jgi:hypothetical protein
VSLPQMRKICLNQLDLIDISDKLLQCLQHCYYIKYWSRAHLICSSYAGGIGLYIYKVTPPAFLNFQVLIFLLKSRCCKWTVDQIIKKLSLLRGQRLSAKLFLWDWLPRCFVALYAWLYEYFVLFNLYIKCKIG